MLIYILMYFPATITEKIIYCFFEDNAFLLFMLLMLSGSLSIFIFYLFVHLTIFVLGKYIGILTSFILLLIIKGIVARKINIIFLLLFCFVFNVIFLIFFT